MCRCCPGLETDRLIPEIGQHILHEHSWDSLAQGLDAIHFLLPVARQGWQSLAPFQRHLPLQACYYFTDGSFFADKGLGGWSVVVLGLQGGVPVRVGWLGGAVPDATAAYDGEVRAIVHALGFCLQNPVAQSFIAADCSAALDLVFGSAAMRPDDAAGAAAVSLGCACRIKGLPVFPFKVTSHAGSFNELADAVAKSAALGSAFPALAFMPNCFWQGVREGHVDWLWTCSCRALARKSWPGGLTRSNAMLPDFKRQEPMRQASVPVASTGF